MLVLERARVEQERVSGAAEQRRGLIHDPARDADGSMLGALQRAGEVERLDLELGDRAQSRRDRDLECRRRREAGADREVRAHGSLDPDGRPPERGQLLLDRSDVPLPAAVVRRTRPTSSDVVSRRDALDANAEVERDRQHEPADEVGVLADQVDAARRPERARVSTPRTPP